MQLQSMKENKIKFDTVAVPFHLIRNAIQVLPYGTSTRVMFMMCAITGCRIREMEKMKVSLLYKHQAKEGWAMIYWKTGKNQTGYRKEELPDYFFEEIKYYRENNRVFADRLFSPDARSFRKYFNDNIRPILSKEWNEWVSVPNQNAAVKLEHRFQLKGLRKSWATLCFAKEYNKWKDAFMAIEEASKRMKHSSKQMTSHHYLKHYSELNIEKYLHLKPYDILRDQRQLKIIDFIKIDNITTPY
jgi:integrase